MNFFVSILKRFEVERCLASYTFYISFRLCVTECVEIGCTNHETGCLPNLQHSMVMHL